MSDCKVRVRFGKNEVECEGSEAFVKDELPELIRLMAELAPTAPEAPEFAERSSEPSSGEAPVSTSKIVGTTLTIAQRLKAKSGRELLYAAAAHLAFVANKEEFSRAELAGAMKSATGVWKQTFMNNLSAIINNAAKEGDLFEVRAGVYALPIKKREELETALAS